MKMPSSSAATLFTAVIVAASVSFAGPMATHATADSCGPSYSEITNFQVGDVFQDQQKSTDQIQNSHYLERKYTVVSRESLAVGFRYGIKGLTRSYFDPAFSSPTSYGTLNETWEFSDSSWRQTLNTCKDKLARIPRSVFPFYSGPFFPSGKFTRVQIAVGNNSGFRWLPDTTRTKILGGPSMPVFTDSAGHDSEYTEDVQGIFAAGLGLVHWESWAWEDSYSVDLSGYIRNGIIHGKVEPDSAFEGPVALRIASPAERKSSDMLRFTDAGPVFRTPGASIFHDLRGRVR